MIRNPGAAFSQGENFTPVFGIAAIACCSFVIFRLVPKIAHLGWAVALGLLCAGVSGNLTDRLFRRPGVLRGHVVDFFQLPHFAIFNVADMCITGGGGDDHDLGRDQERRDQRRALCPGQPEPKTELKPDDG